MNQSIEKKMLCLSVNQSQAEPSINIESSPYYAYGHRWVASVKQLEVFDKEILLRDTEFKKDLAFRIILHLFVENKITLIYQKPCSMMIYPHLKGNQEIIAIGLQVPFDTPKRKCVKKLPIAGIGWDYLMDDEDFKQTLAENILTHLPISKELCYIEDNEKSYYSRARY